MTTFTRSLLIGLFDAFSWFDSGLQSQLVEAGWSEVTRPQTMMLIVIGQGVSRPADIARALNITRQSAGVTIAEMLAAGFLEREDDPTDRRAMIVRISELGEQRRRASQVAMRALTEELARRIGADRVAMLQTALEPDWGRPI